MRRPIQLALFATLAAAFLTWTSLGEKPSAPAAPKKKAKAEKPAELPPPVAAIVGQLVYAEPTPHDGTRNLFAYVSEPVKPVVVVKRETPVPAPVAIARPEPPAPIAPAVEAPRFSYRYIGRFGPDDNPIATFVRDGEIVTARRGDRVGEFVVHAIGIESVDVAGDAGTVRVALGSS